MKEKNVADHDEHVTTVVWDTDCIEGDCDHDSPDDLKGCPSREMEACLDCMVENDNSRDPETWEGVVWPWPCAETSTPVPEDCEP
jgi:hypothetical protein